MASWCLGREFFYIKDWRFMPEGAEQRRQLQAVRKAVEGESGLKQYHIAPHSPDKPHPQMVFYGRGTSRIEWTTTLPISPWICTNQQLGLCPGNGGHRLCSFSTTSKVHGANMGPTWVLSALGGSHVGPMNLAIWELFVGHNVWKNALATKRRKC